MSTTRTHFTFRVDIWDDTGDSIVEHVAGIDDFEVAEATSAAVARWPRARIILRPGIMLRHGCGYQRRPRHQGAAGLARAQEHPAHGALYRVGTGQVQGLLALIDRPSSHG
jgi:hypothetical protein